MNLSVSLWNNKKFSSYECDIELEFRLVHFPSSEISEVTFLKRKHKSMTQPLTLILQSVWQPQFENLKDIKTSFVPSYFAYLNPYTLLQIWLYIWRTASQSTIRILDSIFGVVPMTQSIIVQVLYHYKFLSLPSKPLRLI